MTAPAWLLLDAGNSALKWSLVDCAGGASIAQGTLRNADPETMRTALAQQWRVHAARGVRAAYGCGVAAPALLGSVGDAAAQAFACPVRWFETQREFAHGGVRLRNRYRDPGQLGVDRWHALLAARAAHPQRALVVATAGTATTVDAVTADGDFVGGAIAPGIRMMFDALARGTARLPQAQGRWSAYPDNTDDAIASGVVGCQLGLIERFVRNFRVEHGNPLVVLTGGHAAQLAPHVGVGTSLPSVVREENLVLRGLYLRACELTAGAGGGTQ